MRADRVFRRSPNLYLSPPSSSSARALGNSAHCWRGPGCRHPQIVSRLALGSERGEERRAGPAPFSPFFVVVATLAGQALRHRRGRGTGPPPGRRFCPSGVDFSPASGGEDQHPTVNVLVKVGPGRHLIAGIFRYPLADRALGTERVGAFPGGRATRPQTAGYSARRAPGSGWRWDCHPRGGGRRRGHGPLPVGWDGSRRPTIGPGLGSARVRRSRHRHHFALPCSA
jgi:hypothetical protein